MAPASPTIPGMPAPSTAELHLRHVLPTYGRFPLALVRGEGPRVWDEEGRCFLDFSSGIAVNALGHAHPAMVAAITRQAATLLHTSNLYLTRPQGELAARLNACTGLPGKIFLCNSGAEANEGLYKLARLAGGPRGRHEIISFDRSFHGRTLGGIAATGQLKVKAGFSPILDGFTQVPYGRLECVEAAIGPRTAAVLVEPVQGEGGVHPAPEGFLQGLRTLCDLHGLLLFYDEVQCGLGRTGDWCGWKSVGAEDAPPDGISWAKGLGGGFPIGAFWVADTARSGQPAPSSLFHAGMHGTTYGGSPLACAAALAVLETIEQEGLLANAAARGGQLARGLQQASLPAVAAVRHVGLLAGVELHPLRFAGAEEDPRPAALQATLRLLEAGLLVVPAGEQVIRLLPPLNVTAAECEEALGILQRVLAEAERRG